MASSLIAQFGGAAALKWAVDWTGEVRWLERVRKLPRLEQEGFANLPGLLKYRKLPNAAI